MKKLVEAIRRLSPVGTLVIILGCGALNSWGLLTRGLPGGLATPVGRFAARYDSVLPEITFRDGRPSIREKQPYFVDAFGLKNFTLVIDTREISFASLLNDLSKVENGVVLARETIVVKVGTQIRILPLPQIPDMVLNSSTITQVLQKRSSQVTKSLAVLNVMYGLTVVLLQILILGLVFTYASRLSSASLTYGESFRVASVTMILFMISKLFINIILNGFI